ncbi:T9SS type A sorting domain-containing protein [Dyadobacter sp. NIV53]|uniref:T9SS type A sorting domain-containing protein n=1 Tax=Dyadobacter sp. NIV53 TaxID=2861765 RepID=UPI001C88A38E|nr:T9SS type A sorting domain-containing protein [Dyadobacter sp. NIV53]
MKKLITIHLFQNLNTALLTCLLLLSALSASAQKDWKYHFVNPDSRLTDVAYGAGKYVAVGSESIIRTSADGKTWRTRPTALSEYGDLEGVVYANSKFVAVGAFGIIVTSTDGITWTEQVSGTTLNFTNIAFGNGTFIAVGPKAILATSKNGINWTIRSHGTAAELFDVTYGNGVFAAVGTGGQVKTSADNGVTWVSRTSGTTKVLRAIASGKTGNFVAVGDHGAIVYSNNGFLWAVKTASDPDIALSAVACNPATGSFVAVSSDKYLALTSLDGTYWGNPAVQSGSSVGFYGLRFLNNEFLATGAYTVLRSSNTDGKTWYSTTVNFWDMQMNGVAFGNGRFVAVGNTPLDNGTTGAGIDNLIITTKDGVSYSAAESIRLFSGGHSFNDIAYGNGLFVAVGSDAIIQNSTDGLLWNYSQMTLGQTLKSVAYGNGRFVAVGYNGLILWSTDGKAWSKANSTTNNYYTGVSFLNGGFVLVGQGGVLATSVTGINWTFRSTGTPNQLNSVAYGNGKWMAVGYFNKMVTSANGIQWTTTAFTPNTLHYNDVCFANGQFVLVGLNGKIATNGQPNVWAQPNSGAYYNLNGIAHGNGIFLAVGNSGALVTSVDYKAPKAAAFQTITEPECSNCRTTLQENGEAKQEFDFEATTFPNPVNDQFNLDIKGAIGEKVRLLLVDVSGRTILDKVVEAKNGIYQETIPMTQKQTGMYLLRTSTATQTQTLKILKQ